ncbi:hypothetical protein PVAND_011309 [Polypedilum vanderplanki]|uniref:YTH domain-containing protein n=1 Tax=Polypedilum vanderplanki TaxID=319348 RepID=A0A9J6CJ25_POLVA|nr:hypothetical protein PVAND_011309 [Polypedilum vanderplanki]
MDQLDDEQRKIAEELQQAGYDTRSEANDDSSDDDSSISSENSRSSKHRDRGKKIKNGKAIKDKSTLSSELKDSLENGNKNNSQRKSSSKSPEPKKRRKNSTASNNNNNSSDEAATKESTLKDSKESKPGKKSYDYMTKLNYLFRETKFYVIKSNNAENVRISKQKGKWSTLPQNEQNLNQAYKECRNVILIFSVKESGKFAGFARMAGESRHDVPAVEWELPPGISAKALGGVFEIDWICKKELSFTCTTHLHNPWNDGKPVKIGRDGQEIEPKVAEELCRLFPEDENIDMMPILKKSKEMAKQLREKGITPNIRRSSNPPFSSSSSSTLRSNGISRRGGGFNHMDRGHPSIRGRRNIYKGNSRLGIKSKPIGRKPIFNHRIIHKGHPLHRFGGSTTAAAEAYVADYMRTMQYQLPPMPMNPPANFPGSLPPALPRYYDGVPAIPDYPPPPIRTQPPMASSSSSNYDKRSYDEFMWKNKNRNPNNGGLVSNNRDRSRGGDSRDTYRSGGSGGSSDKHRNYRR